MPTWKVCVRGNHEAELVTAERLEKTVGTYTWWSVTLVINDPRWCCVRRIPTREVTSVEPVRVDETATDS